MKATTSTPTPQYGTIEKRDGKYIATTRFGDNWGTFTTHCAALLALMDS